MREMLGELAEDGARSKRRWLEGFPHEKSESRHDIKCVGMTLSHMTGHDIACTKIA